jgi:hypothetical protein
LNFVRRRKDAEKGGILLEEFNETEEIEEDDDLDLSFPKKTEPKVFHERFPLK